MRSFDGIRAVWIWHADLAFGPNNEKWRDVADRLLSHNINSVILKHDDNGHIFTDAQCSKSLRPTVYQRLIDSLQSVGIKVGLWGYVYGLNIAGELSMLERALSFHPDYYVYDWEVEFRDNIVDPAGYLDHALIIRSSAESRFAFPIGLFHAPLAQPSYHFPHIYCAFQSRLDGAFPQVYHRAMGYDPETALRISYDDFADNRLITPTSPIFPAGQGYDVPADEVLRWGAVAVQLHGATGLSWWKYEDLTDGVIEAIGRVPLSTNSSKEDDMRRINGINTNVKKLADQRWITNPGTYDVPLAGDGWAGQVVERDRRVVVDIEFLPVLDEHGQPKNGTWPRVIVRDGDGAYAGYLGVDDTDELAWRKVIAVYPDATPGRKFKIEVSGGPVRWGMLGLIEAG